MKLLNTFTKIQRKADALEELENHCDFWEAWKHFDCHYAADEGSEY